MNLLNECSLCGEVLKGVYALDGTFEICIKCAEDDGILNRQVRVSLMVQQIRQQLEAEKTGKSGQGLHLTEIVQRLVPDGEMLDIRLREGLKDYYDIVRAFQEDEVRVFFLNPSSTFPDSDELKKALDSLIMYCTTDEEFATWQEQKFPKEAVSHPWMKYIKTMLKNTQSSIVNYHRVRWLIKYALKPKVKGIVKQFEIDREALDIRLKEGLKDYYDVVGIFQDEELMKGGFPTSNYLDNKGRQNALMRVIRSLWGPSIRSQVDEAQIDIQDTNANLTNFNEIVRNSTKDGTSTTITHTQTSSSARTEAVMGNTEKAASVKISRSGSGLDDNNLKLKVKPRRMCLGCTKPFALDEFADENSASGRGNLCVKCKTAPRAWHTWHNR
jgi:hypothetical protein